VSSLASAIVPTAERRSCITVIGIKTGVSAFISSSPAVQASALRFGLSASTYWPLSHMIFGLGAALRRSLAKAKASISLSAGSYNETGEVM
jgi:hypothetical protein